MIAATRAVAPDMAGPGGRECVTTGAERRTFHGRNADRVA
jgi:hypothetical protein